MQLLRNKKAYESDRVFYLPLSQISPNRAQPRQQFDEEGLRALADSIRRYGILQPLSVRRRNGGGFELIAGERRLRAARMVGLREVPCLITATEDADAAVLALIENMQRRDLHYLEEAVAIRRLIEEYHLSQESAAEKLGKSQSAVANKLRLLKLSPACAELLVEYGMTERHARALLRIEDEQQRLKVLHAAAAGAWNVARTEMEIDRLLAPVPPKRKPPRGCFIKDVRLFLNSIDHSVELMRSSGVDASCGRQEDEAGITLTIRIPKTAAHPIRTA